MRLALVAVALVAALSGCAALRAMTAPSADLADYRAFRVAAAEGTRLARAQAYLERHPDGAFADEVREVFAEEEPRYFEACQSSREGARRYLVDLPDGPHAKAAFALLRALESNMADAELLDIARKVRRRDAELEARAVERRAVGQSIGAAIRALTDPEVYRGPRSAAPPALRDVLLGRPHATWGALPATHEHDLFFTLPTRPDAESRLLTLEVSVVERDGRVAEGTIAGSDMFVRWAEADRIVKLDPSSEDDRTEAHVHAMDRLDPMLEPRFPKATCPDRREGQELYHRACDGWEVVVVAGAGVSEKDSIRIVGPGKRGAAEPTAAEPPETQDSPD